jgi:hypothetical protein
MPSLFTAGLDHQQCGRAAHSIVPPAIMANCVVRTDLGAGKLQRVGGNSGVKDARFECRHCVDVASHIACASGAPCAV